MGSRQGSRPGDRRAGPRGGGTDRGDVAVRLVAYLRVSSETQVEQGLGLDVQREAIRTWAKNRGHRIVRWAVDEGESGKNGLDTRVGLRDALEALKSHDGDGLVVYRLDRLARSLTLQEGTLAMAWEYGAAV